jgi:hypothetical protein
LESEKVAESQEKWEEGAVEYEDDDFENDDGDEQREVFLAKQVHHFTCAAIGDSHPTADAVCEVALGLRPPGRRMQSP